MKKPLLTIAFLVLGSTGHLASAAGAQGGPATSPMTSAVSAAWYAPLPGASEQTNGMAESLTAETVTGVGIHQSEFHLLWDDSLPSSDGIVPMAAEPRVANVSEPGTLGLLGLGLAALGLMRSRR